MDYKLNILVEKYFRGETTLEEEAKIRKHLTANSGHTNDERCELSGFFDFISHKQKKTRSRKIRIRQTYHVLGVTAMAASIALFIILSPFKTLTSESQQVVDRVVYLSDLEQQEILETYNQFREYMISTSQMMNEGINSVSHLNKFQEVALNLE